MGGGWVGGYVGKLRMHGLGAGGEVCGAYLGQESRPDSRLLVLKEILPHETKDNGRLLCGAKGGGEGWVINVAKHRGIVCTGKQ